jgi:DNA modification methylase
MHIFQNQKHKIIQADCIEALQTQVCDNSVDLIFADPPYNIGKTLTDLPTNGKQRKVIGNGAINAVSYAQIRKSLYAKTYGIVGTNY